MAKKNHQDVQGIHNWSINLPQCIILFLDPTRMGKTMPPRNDGAAAGARKIRRWRMKQK
jgi:hypothetical protein